MKKVIVVDTNVLLADPNSLLSFPHAEIVIPETVLSELDKLKTARVDPDLRFRGREVSRILFEYSEEGSLVEGVALPDGGSLRVAPFETDSPMPEGLVARNPDDRILATAMHECSASGPECEVQLITNDLNMLLKAQTLGIPVMRYGDGVEGSFGRRYIIKPFQRYRVPLTILAVALAVFAAIIFIVTQTQNPANTAANLPSEFKNLLSAQQTRAYDALVTLQSNPEDPEALLTMAQFYFGQRDLAAANDPVAASESAKQAIRYYQRYLETNPSDNDARVDMATMYFYSSQTDRAIQEVLGALESDPNHVGGNFNLGVFYWQGQRRFDEAVAQFDKVIKLTENDSDQHAAFEQAKVFRDGALRDAEGAGQGTEATPTGGIQ